jgi:small subunit ribosomal protein S16
LQPLKNKGLKNYKKMSVKLRLQRHGRKKRPFYHIVAADSRSPRDGRFIERVGTYNPIVEPAAIIVDIEKAVKWLQVGATPTDKVRGLFSQEGVLFKNHLQTGVNKGAITQEQADEKFAAWAKEKEARTGKILESRSLAEEAEKAKRLQAEKDIFNKRAEARAAALAAAQAPAEETTETEATTEAESASEESTEAAAE